MVKDVTLRHAWMGRTFAKYKTDFVKVVKIGRFLPAFSVLFLSSFRRNTKRICMDQYMPTSTYSSMTLPPNFNTVVNSLFPESLTF